MMLITDQRLFTLPLAMSMMNADPTFTDFGMLYMGMAVTLLPVIIVYLLCSKYIITGISLGSVKE